MIITQELLDMIEEMDKISEKIKKLKQEIKEINMKINLWMKGKNRNGKRALIRTYHRKLIKERKL